MIQKLFYFSTAALLFTSQIYAMEEGNGDSDSGRQRSLSISSEEADKLRQESLQLHDVAKLRASLIQEEKKENYYDPIPLTGGNQEEKNQSEKGKTKDQKGDDLTSSGSSLTSNESKEEIKHYNNIPSDDLNKGTGSTGKEEEGSSPSSGTTPTNSSNFGPLKKQNSATPSDGEIGDSNSPVEAAPTAVQFATKEFDKSFANNVLCKWQELVEKSTTSSFLYQLVTSLELNDKLVGLYNDMAYPRFYIKYKKGYWPLTQIDVSNLGNEEKKKDIKDTVNDVAQNLAKMPLLFQTTSTFFSGKIYEGELDVNFIVGNLLFKSSFHASPNKFPKYNVYEHFKSLNFDRNDIKIDFKIEPQGKKQSFNIDTGKITNARLIGKLLYTNAFADSLKKSSESLNLNVTGHFKRDGKKILKGKLSEIILSSNKLPVLNNLRAVLLQEANTVFYDDSLNQEKNWTISSATNKIAVKYQFKKEASTNLDLTIEFIFNGKTKGFSDENRLSYLEKLEVNQ